MSPIETCGFCKTSLKGRRQTGFTVLEVFTVVGLIALLAVLLLPVAQEVLQRQKGAACLVNMKSFGIAATLYIADHGGLPWWDGQNSSVHSQGDQMEGSTYPNSEAWVRPYLGYNTPAQRLRCPKGSKKEQKATDYAYNYAINANLNFAYPKLQAIPVAHSRVVLAMENLEANGNTGRAVHLNMTMWGIGEGDAGNKNFGVEDFYKIINSRKNFASQLHGPRNKPGLNMFFLDGHAALVAPTDGNWFNPPVYSTTKQPGGLIYDRAHVNDLKKGNSI